MGPNRCLIECGGRDLSLRYREKYLALMEQVLKRPIFHQAMGLALRYGTLPNKNRLVLLMTELGLPLNEKTKDRRASTVRGWLGWMWEQCGRGGQLSLD